MEHKALPKIPQHSWPCHHVSGDEGKTIENCKGTHGSYTEPAEPPFHTSDTPTVTLTINGEQLLDEGRLPQAGDHYEFDESGLGRDDAHWEGDILEVLDSYDLTFEEINRKTPTTQYEFECRVDGSVTKYGMTPSQSMKDCL